MLLAHQTGNQPVKTGSQPVKTGSQPIKQEVLETGFLCYSLTSCVMGRCKQIFGRSENPEKPVKIAHEHDKTFIYKVRKLFV
jgi:hypothetical protein